MLSVKSIVDDRLRTKLKTEVTAPYHNDTGFRITDVISNSPTSFPTLFVNSLGEPSVSDDLEHKTQVAILSTVELKAYTDHNTGTLTDARKLINKAGDIMLSMGYELFFGPQNMSTDTVNCVVARFRRTVGNGDSL